jgi:uncharacterized protein YndB with AHSA1/START domain
MNKSATKTKKAGGIGDDAVRERTGKGWAEWFAILDAAGAKKMSHKEMAQWLYDNHLDSGWWSQMVVVTYEQERGLREKHQKPEGYEISVSRTVEAPIQKAFRVCDDVKSRDRWLGDKGLTVRKATKNHSIRLTWSDGKTHVEFRFLEKGREKCQVVASHRKLAGAKDAARMKKYWAAALERLKAALEE